MPSTLSPTAKTLAQIGLSEKQAVVYDALLNLGKANMGKLLPKIPYKRGNTYDILEELKEKGLVSETEDRGKKLFVVESPSKLHEYLEKQEKEIQQSKKILNTVSPQLKSTFNLITERPNVRFFEGIEGMKQIYDDILNEKKDILLIRANYEPVYEKQIVPIINEFIKTRVRNGHTVSSLTPINKLANPDNKHPEEDKKILMKRTWVDPKLYSAPVEIDIYGNKVALLSFGKELIGTIIESRQIAEALKQIYGLAKLGAEKTTLQTSDAH